MKISAVILTRNEEKNIKECIESLSSFDEIVVIDDESTDKTIGILNDLKDERIKIFLRQMKEDFASQRNFALEKVKNEYVFFIDADERISKELSEELLLVGPEFDGYLVKREDILWGKKLIHGETGNTFLLRLASKKKGRWEGKVHEAWKIEGKVRKLRGSMSHYPHQTISNFLTEINYYTDLRAKEIYEHRVKSNFISIIAYPKGKFILNYIIKKGFLDGIPGLLSALLMSFHSFLVRGKLWLLWQNK